MLRDAPEVDEQLEDLDPEAAVTRLLNQFESIGRGIDAPAQMFSLLCTGLTIEKGALLLPDYDSVHFAPWALRGFDNTSERRMQVPAAMLHDLCPGEAVVILENEQLEPWLRHLSFREGSMIRRIALIPFCDDEKPIAVILIAAGPCLAVENTTIRLIVSSVREQALKLLLHNHDVRMRARFKHVLTDHSDIVRHVSAAFERDSVSSLSTVLIDVAPMLNAICSNNHDVDRYRMQQDVLRIVGSMLEYTATAGLIAPDKICLILQPGVPLGPELIAHQLQIELFDLFHQLPAPLELSPRYISVTREVDSLDKLLSAV